MFAPIEIGSRRRGGLALACACLAGGALAGGCEPAAPAPDQPTSINTAVDKYPDLRTLWSGAMSRTCGPNAGVCHNNRQFPDMQTASGLLRAVALRCNQIRDDPATVDNLCEPAGDQLQLGSFTTRIGSVAPMPATGAPTALVVTLRDPLPAAAAPQKAASIERQRPGLPSVKLDVPAAALTRATPGARAVTFDYKTLSNPKTAPGPAGSLAQFLLPPAFLPGDDTQVELGDPNGDGVFGFDLGGALIQPGDPLKSYLFLRVLGPLSVGPGQMATNVAVPASTEAQMPIANFQYWDLDNTVVALWCWISQMKPDGSNADGPIDYAHCDTTKIPQVTHQGGEAVTFAAVYENILSPQCAGPCHHSGTTQPTSFLMDGPQATYDVLLGIRGDGPAETDPGLPFVTRSDPDSSYLYHKVTGKEPLEGAVMPLGGQLPQSSIDSIGNWIAQGANNN